MLPDESRRNPQSGLPALSLGAVAAVIFAHVACDLFPGYVAPLLRYLKSSWELTRFQTALLALPSSLMIMFQPLFGLFADRMRTRAFVVGGLLASALGYGTALPLAGTIGAGSGYWLALAGMWIGAAGVSAYHPQGAALSGCARTGQSGRGPVAYFVFGGTLGYASGLFVPPLFISEPENIKWIPALTAVAAAALACQVFVPRLRPRGEPLRAPRFGEVFSRLVRDVRPVMGPLAVFWLMVVLRAVTVQCFTQFTSIHYDEALGLSDLAGAAAVAGFFMAQALGCPLAAWLAERFGERLVLAVSFLAGGAIIGLSLVFSGRGMTVLSYASLLLGGGVLGCTVPLNVAAGQRLLSGSRALGSGIMIGLGWGVAGLLVPIIARVGDAFGSTAAMLWTSLALCAPGAALCMFLPEVEPPAAPPPEEPEPPPDAGEAR
ncbi:MAG: MFS transporter [Planctomycetota bacterium]|jgi:FSR family fosmidomycin resistance protein-like MFS transporter